MKGKIIAAAAFALVIMAVIYVFSYGSEHPTISVSAEGTTLIVDNRGVSSGYVTVNVKLLYYGWPKTITSPKITITDASGTVYFMDAPENLEKVDLNIVGEALWERRIVISGGYFTSSRTDGIREVVDGAYLLRVDFFNNSFTEVIKVL
jgi:hypothetical protein